MTRSKFAGRVPDRVLKYLHPEEELLYLARPHPAQFSREILMWAGAAIVLALAIGLHAALFGVLVIVIATLPLLAKATPWWQTCYAITNKRVIVLTGVVADTVIDVPIKLVIDIKYQRRLLGLMLGYGHFELNLSGRPSLRELVWVTDPDYVYWLLTRLRGGGDSPWSRTLGDAPRKGGGFAG